MITSKKSHTPQGLDKNLVLQEPSFIVKNLSYKTRVKLDLKNPGWRTHNSSDTGVETEFFVLTFSQKKSDGTAGVGSTGLGFRV